MQLIWPHSWLTLSNTTFVTIPIDKKEVVLKVYDIPNTNEIAIEDNHFLDLAIKSKEYNLLGILPL